MSSKCGCNKVNNVKVEPVKFTDLQNDINLLVANRMMVLDEVQYGDKKVQKALDNVKLAVNMLYDTPQYENISYMISKAKKKLSNLDIKPQTVGAYLFGCNLDNYGDVKSSQNSGLCAGGSVPNKVKLNSNHYIFYHNGDVLKLLSSPGSNAKKPDVLLYVEPQFKGLTQLQLETIKKEVGSNKINSVLVYHTVGSKHQLVETYSDLSKIPIVSGGPTGVLGELSGPGGHTGSTGTSRGLYVSTSVFVWAVILIVVIIVLLAALGWWSSNRNNRA